MKLTICDMCGGSVYAQSSPDENGAQPIVTVRNKDLCYKCQKEVESFIDETKATNAKNRNRYKHELNEHVALTDFFNEHCISCQNLRYMIKTHPKYKTFYVWDDAMCRNCPHER